MKEKNKLPEADCASIAHSTSNPHMRLKACFFYRSLQNKNAKQIAPIGVAPMLKVYFFRRLIVMEPMDWACFLALIRFGKSL